MDNDSSSGLEDASLSVSPITPGARGRDSPELLGAEGDWAQGCLCRGC